MQLQPLKLQRTGNPIISSYQLLHIHWSYNLQIVDVNLTSESRVKLDLNAKIPFTYEVIWKETRTKFTDRFDKYLDPNFFQHRVRRLPRSFKNFPF